jgi:cell division protein ZapB
MSRIEDLTERVERLLLRHDELQRTNALLEQQLHVVSQERDSLRARLSAARARIDALLDKLPATDAAAAQGGAASDHQATDLPGTPAA